MAAGVSIEDVTRAADAVLAKGERPTIDSVRAHLGTGSPNTVNPLLKQYFRSLPDRLNLPAPIAVAAAELYKKVRDAAQEDVDKRDAEQQAALKLQRAQVQTERTAFEAERSQLRSATTALETELTGLKDRHAALERQLSAAQGEAASQARNASAAEAKAQAATDERERAARKHQEEIASQKERAEGNERHFLTQIDDLKTQLKKLGSDREKEQATASKRIADLEAKGAELVAEIAEQRKEVIRLNADLSREQRSRAAAESELKTKGEAAVREIDLANGQRAAALAERDAERLLVEQLRREKDAAMRDSAVQQGRADTLQIQVERLQTKKPTSKSSPSALIGTPNLRGAE